MPCYFSESTGENWGWSLGVQGSNFWPWNLELTWFPASGWAQLFIWKRDVFGEGSVWALIALKLSSFNKFWKLNFLSLSLSPFLSYSSVSKALCLLVRISFNCLFSLFGNLFLHTHTHFLPPDPPDHNLYYRFETPNPPPFLHQKSLRDAGAWPGFPAAPNIWPEAHFPSSSRSLHLPLRATDASESFFMVVSSKSAGTCLISVHTLLPLSA